MLLNAGYTNLGFKGTTKYFAITDVHQSTENHCRLVSKILEEARQNKNIVLLDNGDFFLGVYPKYTQEQVYLKTKEANPDLEIIYNVGNNDLGFNDKNKEFFWNYVQKSNQAGIHILSANMFDRFTKQRPEGIKPYTVINKDGDNILYIGFAPLIDQSNSDVIIEPADKILEKMLPEIKRITREKNVKGVVILLHDELEIAEKLEEKAKELGIKVEFIVGGHSHKTDEKSSIFYPAPFGQDMISFDLIIEDGKHTITPKKRYASEKIPLDSVYLSLINNAKKEKEFDKVEAKFTIPLKFVRDQDHQLQTTELGTAYADGIKAVTDAEIGIVPKGWIWAALTSNSDNIKKIDVLNVIKQPFRPIHTIKINSRDLKTLIENKLKNDNEIFEFSGNMKLILDSKENNKIKQIYVDGKALFNEQDEPVDPKRTISCAIDYFTLLTQDFISEQSDKSMYEGFVHQIKYIGENYSKGDYYTKAEFKVENPQGEF